MDAIFSLLKSANGYIKSGYTKLSQPVVLNDGTVVEDPADVHLYNLKPEGWVAPEPDATSDFQNNMAPQFFEDLDELEQLKEEEKAIQEYWDEFEGVDPDNPMPDIERTYEIKERIALLENRITQNGLLVTGNYDNHFLQGLDLDLDKISANATAFNGNENQIVLQSIFDPEVSSKPLTIDEYSVVVNLPDNMPADEFLTNMALDMDNTLGSDFKHLGDFDRQGDALAVGQVIEIDVKDTKFPIPLIDDESPVNAPVIITEFDANSHFKVQTIELDGKEHPLHGTREWGFEEMPDGSTRFYTRGISVEDTFGAELFAKGGEKEMWSTWVSGVENTVIENGGSVVDGSKVISQTGNAFTAEDLFENLSPEEQKAIRG